MTNALRLKVSRIEENGIIYAELPPIVFRIPVLRPADSIDGYASVLLNLREQQVFEMARRARSAKQIAAGLNIAVRTVKFHLSRIFAKLGVSDSKELIFKFRPNP